MSRPRLWTLLLILALAGCAPPPSPAFDATVPERPARAYEGAPPPIPHEVAELGREDCLACHGEGLRTPDGVALVSPHLQEAALGCRTCHVAQVATQVWRQNGFRGRGAPKPIPRAYAGAPPQIPHETFMRGNCLACHGPEGYVEIRTPHPERPVCQQCHVPGNLQEKEWRANGFTGG